MSGRLRDWIHRHTARGEPAPGLHTWRPGDVPLRVLLARDFADDYADAVTAAADYWQRAALAKLWTIEIPADQGTPALHGIPTPGVVAVHYEGSARGQDPAHTWRDFHATLGVTEPPPLYYAEIGPQWTPAWSRHHACQP